MPLGVAPAYRFAMGLGSRPYPAKIARQNFSAAFAPAAAIYLAIVAA